MKAIWKNQVIAESDDTAYIEGNHYFPESSIKKEFFEKTDTATVCHWKGTASYYSIHVDGATNKDAAWYYPTPKEQAKMVKGHVAFWRGVEIVK